MKPPLFEYHAPGSVDEALTLLAEQGDDANRRHGGEMSRSTVIRHQNLTACIKREHLAQSRFSGKWDDAA